MATFLDLPNPVDELAAAVSALIDPPGAAGLPPLLDQLIEAAESSSSRGGAVRNRQTAPVSLDVLGLLGALDRWVAEGLRRSGYRGRLDGDRAALVRSWAAHAGEWRSLRSDYLHASIGEVRRWVTRAENILHRDPQTVETRAQPCPACRERTILLYSEDHGERVQRPSLYLDTARMVVVCRCCGAEWASVMWPWLCRVLADRSVVPTS